MVQLRRRAPVPLLVSLLFGCAANQDPPRAATEERGPDCSFRSPTTCWSAGGRFPTPIPPEPVQPERITQDSAAVLAALADSVRGSTR
jgi:hypothetical protein